MKHWRTQCAGKSGRLPEHVRIVLGGGGGGSVDVPQIDTGGPNVQVGLAGSRNM